MFRSLGLFVPKGSVRFSSSSSKEFSSIISKIKINDSNPSKLDKLKFPEQIEQISNKPINPSFTAKSTAERLKVTGPLAGRIVTVRNGDINTAYRNIKFIINSNNIRGESMAQRFHMKPGKKLELKRIRRKKKMFNEGIRRLMDLVKEAKRRGY